MFAALFAPADRRFGEKDLLQTVQDGTTVTAAGK
jgi:hypothetical protein